MATGHDDLFNPDDAVTGTYSGTIDSRTGDISNVQEFKEEHLPEHVRKALEAGYVLDDTSVDGEFRITVKRDDKPFESDHYHGRLEVTHVPSGEVLLNEEVGLTFPELPQMQDAVVSWFNLADDAIDAFLAKRKDVRSNEDRP